MSERDMLLSLIVPSYNHGVYLEDLIKSIYGGVTSLGLLQRQLLLPDEIIISDDCSTDNTEEIVGNLQQEYPNIIYVKTRYNGGTPQACNVAIDRAKGKFIARIDADDMREYDSLKYLMDKIQEFPESFVYDDVRIVHKGQRLRKWKMPEYDFHDLLERNIIHAGIMFPKSAWKLAGGYPENFDDGRDDWSFNVALGVIGCCGIHVEGTGYLYRRDQQNRTLKNSSSYFQRKYAEKMRSHFSQIYAGRFPMSCCGGRKDSPTVATNLSSRISTPLVGSEGMTLVQYDGGNYGKETFFGPVTGSAYVFSRKLRVKNVDNRDLHTRDNRGLLDLFNGASSVFSTVKRQEVDQSLETSSVSDNVQITIEVSSVEETSTEEVPEDADQVGTLIEAGQISGIGKASVRKLNEEGITTWEEFIGTDNEKIGEILKLGEEAVVGFKQSLVEDESEEE